MKCRRFRDLIRPYLDERVDGVLGNEFRWHRLFCRACGERFNQVRARRPRLPSSPAPGSGRDRHPSNR